MLLIANICYISVTTDDPKGVVYRHHFNLPYAIHYRTRRYV